VQPAVRHIDGTTVPDLVEVVGWDAHVRRLSTEMLVAVRLGEHLIGR
jgi:hypothetical protein